MDSHVRSYAVMSSYRSLIIARRVSLREFYWSKSLALSISCRHKIQAASWPSLRLLHSIPSDVQSKDAEVANRLYSSGKNSRVHASGVRLPVSPLADTFFLRARNRWTAPKPPKELHKKTKLQKKLSGNPFAQVLASPGRMCSATKVQLPRDFLQGFRMMAHPQTKDPWWVPFDLAARTVTPSASSPNTSSLSSASSAVTSTTGPTAYTLSRRDLILSSSTSTGRYKGSHKQFLRNSGSSGLTAVPQNIVWRTDMDAHILELMRRRIFEDLLYLSVLCGTAGRRYLVPFQPPLHSIGLHQLGCVFHLQPSTTNIMPRPFAEGLPAYDLCTLLGEELVSRLSTEAAMFRNAHTVLMRGYRTIGLQKRLWRLFGFIQSRL